MTNEGDGPSSSTKNKSGNGADAANAQLATEVGRDADVTDSEESFVDMMEEIKLF